METVKDLRAKNARLATKNGKLRRAIAAREEALQEVAKRDVLIGNLCDRIERQHAEIVRLRKAGR